MVVQELALCVISSSDPRQATPPLGWYFKPQFHCLCTSGNLTQNILPHLYIIAVTYFIWGHLLKNDIKYIVDIIILNTIASIKRKDFFDLHLVISLMLFCSLHTLGF